MTVPSPQAMRAAHAALDPNGRLNRLVGRDAQRPGRLLRLHARGRTRVVTEGRRLEDVNECFEEVLAGRVLARLVFEM